MQGVTSKYTYRSRPRPAKPCARTKVPTALWSEPDTDLSCPPTCQARVSNQAHTPRCSAYARRSHCNRVVGVSWSRVGCGKMPSVGPGFCMLYWRFSLHVRHGPSTSLHMHRGRIAFSGHADIVRSRTLHTCGAVVIAHP